MMPQQTAKVKMWFTVRLLPIYVPIYYLLFIIYYNADAGQEQGDVALV
jgi:hypothetical protein